VNLSTNTREATAQQYVVTFDYRTVINLTIRHNEGNAISVKSNLLGALGSLSTGCCGQRYEVIGFHFHSPSEHVFSLRNKDSQGRYPMELHIMHQRLGAKGHEGLMAVVVFFDVKKTPGNNAFLDQLDWTKLPQDIGDSRLLSHPVSLALLDYSLSSDFFVYNGSLSTPDCSETVEYRVFSRPQGMAQAQLDALRAATRRLSDAGNFRNLQPRNGRAIILVKQTPSFGFRFASVADGSVHGNHDSASSAHS